MYIHERKDWPEFKWNQAKLTPLLGDVRHLQGRLLGRMEALGFQLREEATLQILTQDVVKTSEIEGEKLNAQQVRSSLARRLGIDIGALPPIDRNIEGIVEIMLDATGNYDSALTQQRMFSWHAALFPTGRSGMRPIVTGAWRTEASGDMQVVSGPIGREKIHYQAPSHDLLKKEMAHFIKWCNGTLDIDPVLKSAVAHFAFVTIHPFEDGNGRIARAIADLMLARSEKTSQRFYSMSSQIQRDRKEYYIVLEACQKGTLDITPWMDWYLKCLKRAIHASDMILAAVLTKDAFWKVHSGKSLNDRQRKVINRLLDGFEGKLTSSKWARLTQCSQDTALRDINELLNSKILTKAQPGGRSTSYELSS